jgi:hypothetical protein
MYWLRRPPYLRWFAAAFLLVLGFYMEMRPSPVEPYPFAAESIPMGSPIEQSISWRDVPQGLLPHWESPVAGIARSEILVGDPLLPSLTGKIVVPDDWWAVPLPLPIPAPPGTLLRLVLDGTDSVVEGLVVATGLDTGFETIGMVAFAPADALLVANGASHDALVVMVGLGSNTPPSTG